MSQKRLPIIIGAIVGVVVICICGSTVAYMAWNTPLGPALSTNTETFIPSSAVVSNLPTANPLPVPGANTPFPLPTATQPSASPVVNCGESGSQNFLILGVDAPMGMRINGPLAIRIVKVDFSRKTTGVFSFPRDLWLPVKGLEGYGFTQARLGEAYLIAKSNAGYSTAAATNLVAQILNNNFGAVSNHYITAKLSTLAAVIDAVGGITVNVPVVYDGTPYGFHYFPAGPNHMTGTLALEYAISVNPWAQWSGLDRQTQVLQALFQKIFSSEIIPKVPSLIPQFLQAVTTDLSLQQITDLVCISQQIPADKIAFGGVGSSDVTYGASGVLYPNIEAIRAKVVQFFSQA